MPKTALRSDHSVCATAYELFIFSFHSALDMFFAIKNICRPFHFQILGKNCPCMFCLPMFIQIMTLVTKSAMFDKPTTKMLVWLHLAELIIEKNIIKFLEVHSINIWGSKPHGIVLISGASHGIRFIFLRENVVYVPLLLLLNLFMDMDCVTCSNRQYLYQHTW